MAIMVSMVSEMLDVRTHSDIQIEIPQAVLDTAGVKPGQKLVAMNWGNSIVLVPALSVAELRGRLSGIENDFVRDKSDRDIG